MDKTTEEIKLQIIEELGLLSYLEKKKIKANLDEEFIKKELNSIKKQKKYIKSFVALWIAGSFVVACILIYTLYSQPKYEYNLFIFLFVVYIINTFLAFISKYKLDKRESLYKILSAFNSGVSS